MSTENTEKKVRKSKEKKRKKEKKTKKEVEPPKVEKKQIVSDPAGEAEPVDSFQQARDDILAEERPLINLAGITHFDVPTVRELKSMFTEISSSEVKDGIIDLKELTNALGLNPNSVLAKTLFRLFDVTKTKSINFRVWVTTLSALSPEATLDDKIKFSFALYDINGDGKIDKEELKTLLTTALHESMGELQLLNNEQVDDVVNNTLASVDLDGNGSVEYSEYYDMVIQSPATVLRSYTLDISSLCAAYRTIKTKHKLLDSEIERRKENIQLREQIRKEHQAAEKPPKMEALKKSTSQTKSQAPSDSELDLNAKPVTNRDLSVLLGGSSEYLA